MSVATARLYDKQTSEKFYDERYSGGYMDDWPPEKKHRVIEVIRGLNLPESGEALDFGCGNGVFTEVIRLALPQWQIYGTDLSSVALQTAKTRYPDCNFFTPSDKNLMSKKFDFLFTHHVLEHVYNLDAVWREIVNFMKPDASALHILPCGNEGSFEHAICQLRVDGIDDQIGSRFFFEDQGHVRRLSTRQMDELAARSGLELAREYYANQHHGAIEWITASGMDFFLTLTESENAKDAEAKAKLLKIRRKLKPVVWARDLVSGVRARRHKEKKTAKNWAGLIARLPIFVVCRIVDQQTRRKAEAEWEQSKNNRNGSEMYLHFKRTS
ncbi:MAG: methyltransferase domain-containing protein [Pyrinomonadaceae bacterium]|nr:methyltransferase domain-containing protein [Pyrinomonadaceae bacterium]